MTVGGLSHFTVSFCSVVHFERPASTADGRVMTFKEEGSHACHATQSTINTSECEINTHCSIGGCVHGVYACPIQHSSRDTAAKKSHAQTTTCMSNCICQTTPTPCAECSEVLPSITALVGGTCRASQPHYMCRCIVGVYTVDALHTKGTCLTSSDKNITNSNSNSLR